MKSKVSVRKNGQMKELEIDHTKNSVLQTSIMNFLQKNKCADIFKDTVIPYKNGKKLRLYEKKSDKKFIQEKRIRTEGENILKNL